MGGQNESRNEINEPASKSDRTVQYLMIDEHIALYIWIFQ